MISLQSDRCASAIRTSAELALLFENEAKWEAAERTRVLLYYLMKGNYAAARRLISVLQDEKGANYIDARAVDPEIVERVCELVAAVNYAEEAEREQSFGPQ